MENNILTAEQQERYQRLMAKINVKRMKFFRILRMVLMIIFFLSFMSFPVLILAIRDDVEIIIIITAITTGAGLGGFLFILGVFYIAMSPKRGVTTTWGWTQRIPTAKEGRGFVVEIFTYQRGGTHVSINMHEMATRQSSNDPIISRPDVAMEASEISVQGSKYVAFIYSDEIERIMMSYWGNDNLHHPSLGEEVLFDYNPKKPKWAYISRLAPAKRSSRKKKN